MAPSGVFCRSGLCNFETEKLIRAETIGGFRRLRTTMKGTANFCEALNQFPERMLPPAALLRHVRRVTAIG